MGISISRKHDKRSVWRNRSRRLVYDALLPAFKQAMQTAPSGAQCVFVLKK
jgi:ribonuclease P protein component